MSHHLNQLRKMNLIYLASPYTHNSKKVMKKRFEEITQIAADFFTNDIHLITPITTSHIVSLYGDFPGKWDFWETYDTKLLTACDALLVAKMDGWSQSVGVTAEIAIARRQNKPIYFYDPKTKRISLCKTKVKVQSKVTHLKNFGNQSSLIC